MFGGTLKDKITNIIAFVMVILAAVQTYLGTIGGDEIDWFQLIIYIVGAVVAYLTGKGGDAKVKKT